MIQKFYKTFESVLRLKIVTLPSSLSKSAMILLPFGIFPLRTLSDNGSSNNLVIERFKGRAP
jgi:hypothetical protein